MNLPSSAGLLALLAVPPLVLASGPTPTSEAPARVHALAIGISTFPHLPSTAHLAHGETDATWFADTLRESGTPLKVTPLVGQQATAQRMRQEVQALLARTPPGEIAIIYASTLGAQVGARGYLLAADSRPEAMLPATALPLDEIAAAVKRSLAAQVFILTDTRSPEGIGAQVAPGPMRSVSAQLGAIARERTGVFVLPSERRGAQGSPCPGRGLYACALVAALRGGADANRDDVVTLPELAGAVQALLKAQPGGNVSVASYGKFDADLGVRVAAKPTKLPFSAEAWKAPDRIEVCFAANGVAVPVTHVFHTGDELSLSVTTPEEGFMYVVNIGPDGAEDLLFPLEGEDNGVAAGTTAQIMPLGDVDPIVLVDPAGSERVFIIWSATPLAESEAALTLARGRVGGSAKLEAWTGVTGSKGLSRLSQVDDRGEDHCTWLTPSGEAGAWVVELTLNHT